jgi:hypothetical protein
LKASSKKNGLVLIAGMLVGFTGFCCSGPDQPPRWPDAGPPDGGDDAGEPRDAGGDAGHLDAGRRDGGPAGWRPIPGLPPECDNAFIAENPAAVVEPLRFEPCPEYESGCRQLIIDWDAPHGTRASSYDRSGEWLGTEGRVLFRRTVEPNAQLVVVARSSGEIEAVLRLGRPTIDFTPCSPLWMGVHEGTLAMVLLDPGDEEFRNWIVAGRMDDLPGSIRLLTTLDRMDIGASAAQYVFPTELGVGLRITPKADAWWVPLEGEPVRFASREDGAPADLEDAFGTTILYTVRSNPYEIWSWHPGDANGTPFINPSGAYAIAARTDGTDVVWLQGYGQITITAFERIALMTAPMADPGAAREIVPRLPLTDIHGAVEVGYGYALVGEARNEIGVYALADGTRRAAVGPEGTYWGDFVLYMGPEEMALGAKREMGSPPELQTIQFVRYDALPLDPLPE